MKKYSKKTFDDFVVKYGDSFPYTNVRRTRNSFYSKWLLMESPSRGGIFILLEIYSCVAKLLVCRTLVHFLLNRHPKHNNQEIS